MSDRQGNHFVTKFPRRMKIEFSIDQFPGKTFKRK